MKLNKLFLSIFPVSFLLLLTGCSHTPTVESKLDEYVKALVDMGQFSGSVLVAKDGKILLCKGYGMANYELDVPNMPQTKFRLGSITKQFTAMAIMQLQERGLLSVTDKLSKYIPDYPHGDEITIHHLLTHTSGIVAKISECNDEKIKPHTIQQVIALFKNKPLDFKPGEKYSYSNAGYIVLSYIIEKASGKKYEEFLREYVFMPLGMNSSGYDQASLIIKKRASGYNNNGDELVNASCILVSFFAGAGCLYSTIEDFYIGGTKHFTQKHCCQKLF